MGLLGHPNNILLKNIYWETAIEILLVTIINCHNKFKMVPRFINFEKKSIDILKWST